MYQNLDYSYYNILFPQQVGKPDFVGQFYGQIHQNKLNKKYFLRGMVKGNKLIWTDETGPEGHCINITEEFFSKFIKPVNRETFDKPFLKFIDSNQWLIYIDTMKQDSIEIPKEFYE